MVDLTPIQRHGEYWFKRDDLYTVAGVSGGKARTAWALAQGAVGLVTAGSRASPQANIVAHIAQALGIPCRIHTATGKLLPELVDAQKVGAEVFQHYNGFNVVISARARADAKSLGWTYIPFGMECIDAVKQTAVQVANIPSLDIQRIVIPCGSGMSLAGVLHGLRTRKLRIPVLGVCSGANSIKRLDKYAPKNWREMVQLVPSGLPYNTPAPHLVLAGVTLDPHYEAKCIPFIEPGDLLWIVGIRRTPHQQRTAYP